MTWRVSFVPPWRFSGRRWWAYLWPRRITASFRERHVYRWIAWNFGRRP